LLLLDGTEEADDLAAVLRTRGGCGVLVTSRARKDALAERQDVRPLVIDEAVKLLQAWGGDWAADEKAARRICELVGGLPLAVRLVGRYLNETPETATEYLKWLETAPFEALDPDEEHRRLESVPWLLERSLEQVNQQARDVLALVGRLALAPFSQEVVVKVLQLDTASLKRALRQLTGYGLLLRSDDYYEVSHALIHTYARERLAVPDEVSRRLVDYYIELAKTESKKESKGYHRLDTERAHVMRVLAGCDERGEWEAVIKLMKAIEDYLRFQGYWTERRMAVDLGLTAAQRLQDRGEQANCIKALGDVHISLSEYEQARQSYQEARPIYAQIGDRYSYAASSAHLGLVFQGLEKMDQARQYLSEAVAIFEEIKSPHADLVRRWLAELGEGGG